MHRPKCCYQKILDGVFMNRKTKLLTSLLAGLLALLLSTPSAWWGVLFSPLTRQLSAAPAVTDCGTSVQEEDVHLRFFALDFLISLWR